MKMNILLSATLLFALHSTNVIAEDTDAIKRGAAKAFYCTDCHGYNGMGTAIAPAIAGQEAKAIAKKLADAKNKKSSIKGAILARFDAADLNDLTLYFSSLEKTANGSASFKRDIQPIIKWRCLSCHEQAGEGTQKSGLQLNTYDALMAGTQQGGDLIIPGSPESSTFMIMLTRQDHMRMPFGQVPLSDSEIRVIRAWIDQGAKNN